MVRVVVVVATLLSPIAFGACAGRDIHLQHGFSDPVPGAGEGEGEGEGAAAGEGEGEGEGEGTR